MASSGYADNENNTPDYWDSGSQKADPEQTKVLDDSNSISINGTRVANDNVDPRFDISGSTGDTGIGIRRAGGTDFDFFVPGYAWFDAGLESVGKNGVLGASAADFGAGILGINRHVYGFGVRGLDYSDNSTDPGVGVYGETNSANGIAVKGKAANGGLAASFEDGDVTQTLPNNGVVKGWAKIAADGTIVSCYKCNTDSTKTYKVQTGGYSVSFSPLGTDISARPRTATLDTHGGGTIMGEIGLASSIADASAIYVKTADSAGVSADKSFTVVLY